MDGRLACVVAACVTARAFVGLRKTRPRARAGPDAPLDLERGLSASHMEHAYDFYKPAGLYPLVRWCHAQGLGN